MTLPTAALVTSGNLQDRAVEVNLTLRRWTARKTDKRITREVNTSRGIAQEMGNYTKHLIAPAALDKIEKLQGQWRNWHLSMTLPWLDNGARVLPTPFFTAYAKQSREFEAQHAPLVQQFVQDYPAHYAEARNLLGADWRAEDYPAAWQIAERFSARYIIREFPDPSDYRLPSALSASDTAAIKAEAIAGVQDALRAANIDIIKRLLEPVQHMAQKLRTYDAALAGSAPDAKQVRFHDTIVENIERLITLVPAFNITNDPIVTDFARQCVALIKHSPDDLRDDAKARADTADEAERIAAAMSQFV